jgi:hypothetical protein
MSTKQAITAKVKEILGTSDDDMIRSVVKDVEFSGDPELVLCNESLIKRLGEKFQERVEGNKKRVQAEDAECCPICKFPLKPVRLAGDRKAVWCSKHFVVFPIKES